MSALSVMHQNSQTCRHAFVQALFARFTKEVSAMQMLTSSFALRAIPLPPIDHFAIIDLPGAHSGIPILKTIFSELGWYLRGNDYLENKQNDFVWLAPLETQTSILAHQALPQVVVADFRLDCLPKEVAHIILKYANKAVPFPFVRFRDFLSRLPHESAVIDPLLSLLLEYFAGRSWPLPTHAEFEVVHAANPLLAWVLVHGPSPNHFTLAMHLQETFKTFTDFLHYLTHELALTLNQQDGMVKGSPSIGIEQASTKEVTQQVALSDQRVALPQAFIEFVWRYPISKTSAKAHDWHDYFTGFIATQADRVVESLIQ